MPDEAVFYFDVLGFSTKDAGGGDAGVDALSALATILGSPSSERRSASGHIAMR